MTSGTGLRRAEQLAADEVAITVFVHAGDDVGTSYYGPIIHETETHIRISVYGEPMKEWRKRDCVITRADSA